MIVNFQEKNTLYHHSFCDTNYKSNKVKLPLHLKFCKTRKICIIVYVNSSRNEFSSILLLTVENRFHTKLEFALRFLLDNIISFIDDKSLQIIILLIFHLQRPLLEHKWVFQPLESFVSQWKGTSVSGGWLHVQRNIHDLQQEWGKSKFIIWNNSTKSNMQKLFFILNTIVILWTCCYGIRSIGISV